MDQDIKEQLNNYYNRIVNSHTLNVQLEFHQFMFYLIHKTELKLIIQELKDKANYSKSIDTKLIERYVKTPKIAIFDISDSQYTFYYQLAFKYCLLEKLFSRNISFLYFSTNIKFKNSFAKGDPIERAIAYFISPVINFLVEKVSEHRSFLGLLTKYKKRKEWFFRDSFYDEFDKNNRRESFLEMDLRAFLFDNGVSYPFSNLNTPSGRPDIVSGLEKKESLILEVKFLDESKSYKDEKITLGINQGVKYVGDFQKKIGYIVIFNANSRDIEVSIDNNTAYPAECEINGKLYYVIIININPNGDSASQIKNINWVNLELKGINGE